MKGRFRFDERVLKAGAKCNLLLYLSFFRENAIIVFYVTSVSRRIAH